MSRLEDSIERLLAEGYSVEITASDRDDFTFCAKVSRPDGDWSKGYAESVSGAVSMAWLGLTDRVGT